MQDKVVVQTDKAPAAVGPYSQAIRVGSLIFTAGQIGIDPRTGQLVSGLEAQVHQVMQNLQAILQAAGSDLQHLVKTTIYLTDLSAFQTVNAIYAEYVGTTPPARSTVQVAALPLAADVEIEAVAVVPE
ncbi:MAG: RidA family protein [Chloroflexi bacterium]|nr:RidA family protein [Chloroflexota bacterium]